MKRTILALTAALTLVTPLVFGGAAYAEKAACQPPPVVSGAWLESHGWLNDLVIVDVRTAAEYAAGHIRDSVNIPLEVPFSAWITMRDDLLLELPDAAELSAALGSFGITKDSVVVVVTSVGQPPYPQANATRAADTLLYAGVSRVSILNGGYPAWVAQGRETTTEVPAVTPVAFNGVFNGAAFVGIDHVYRSIGRSIIIDARDADVYSGAIVEPWADKAGHIPSAVSLPAPLIWNEDGTYKSVAALRALAQAAIGTYTGQEIIVYCGVGGYGSSWLYVLTKVLGFGNVKLYDGSAQEWVRHYDMELSPEG